MISIDREWLERMSALYQERLAVEAEIKNPKFIYGGKTISDGLKQRAREIDDMLEAWYVFRAGFPREDRDVIDAFILYSTTAMRAASLYMTPRTYQRRVQAILEKYK